MLNNTENRAYAGFFARFIAHLVDLLIVLVGNGIAKVVFTSMTASIPQTVFTKDFIFQYSILDIFLYFISATYFVLFTYLCGATPGKRLMSLKVVSIEDRKMTLIEVVYRETVGRFLSAVVLYIGYFMVIFQKEKRGIHDLLSDTKVVYCVRRKETVLVPVEVRQVKKPIAVTPYRPASYIPASAVQPQAAPAAPAPVPEESEQVAEVQPMEAQVSADETIEDAVVDTIEASEENAEVVEETEAVEDVESAEEEATLSETEEESLQKTEQEEKIDV